MYHKLAQPVRLLNRLRLGFRHLREHKFRHKFADNLNLLCSCSQETEDTEQNTLPKYLSFCPTLANDLNNINTVIASLNLNELVRVILCEDKTFNKETNCKILDCNYQTYKRYLTFWKISFLIYTNHPIIITVDNY